MRSATMAASARGRPRKYGRPARAVTVTLPEDVLALLSAADADLGHAIVKLVERRAKAPTESRKPAEVATYGSRAVIVVPAARALSKLPGVQLVPIGNGRCLIALEPPYSIPQLELDIRDVLARNGASGPERQTLDGIAAILRNARVSREVTPEQRTIIVLETRRRRNGDVRSSS